jgi:4-amino-4-deoxy-L-arabinose transferase-like glycosyltransferase
MRASSNSARSAIWTETATAALRPASRREVWQVVLACMVLSLAALVYCWQHQWLLLYGDAIAHLHIARRILDSRTPGFRQLGSVWLPLPHLLLLPFVQKMSWWRSGVAGALPSMLCYAAACGGLLRLARMFLRPPVALVAVAFFALNPGLLYFSTTAMTEPLFLAEIVWAALLIALFTRRSGAGQSEGLGRLLLGAALVLVCAVYTRYDGWIYTAAAWCVASFAVVRRRNLRERLTGVWLLGTVLVLVAPLVWIAYNARQFHDPLDFMRGPYSARAIELRTSPAGAGHYPGYHNMRIAWLYYLKAAELGATVQHAADLLLLLALGGLAVLWVRRRAGDGLGAALLLWLPLPFYAYSLAYGSVPIFIPLWFPHSWYNTRYGMEMLPAFALFSAAALDGLMAWRPRWSGWLMAGAAVLLLANACALLRARPLVFQEAVANSRSRIPFEQALAQGLTTLPAGATLLMVTSDHIGAVPQAGLPLRQIINEGDYYAWRPALEAPARSAAYVVALDGDAVAQAVERHPGGLELEQVICSTGQPCARIYASRAAGGSITR